MIFTCNKQEILEGISIVQKAITGKSTLPILEGINIITTENGLKLTGSDLDMSIETLVNANIIESGKIVIDAKLFGDIIRKMPNSTIKMETKSENIVTITCEKSVFDLVYKDSSEFPKLPNIVENLKISVKQNMLKNMIKGTSFAVASDETRPILQGILFEIKENRINLVALDGYRLAVKSEYLDSDNDIEVVIPGKTLNEVGKILEESDENLEITFTNNHILFNIKETKVISRLLEGKFINYRSLLPQEYKLSIVTKTLELQNAIERASLVAKEGNTNLIKINVDKDTLIISSNSQLGKVREEITINLQGEEIEIAFNSKYLLDILKNIETNNVVLKMTSEVSPCVIEEENNENDKYLVLPVRLVR
ncbi:DNA polymerase III subunit beta [Clostridium sp. BJN0001]|uniref:DNA polymerase III subunit beta n=1 Tax=Clostridium sp. BJN0001 TaxID=2930219 RepID=UPI001FD26FC9|nr:DNA polymerase III subunit beta [Clostridium sp. BJN0001]